MHRLAALLRFSYKKSEGFKFMARHRCRFIEV
jgi:hypothetical protein